MDQTESTGIEIEIDSRSGRNVPAQADLNPTNALHEIETAALF